MNSITLTRPYTSPVQATRQSDGSCVLRCGSNHIALDADQLRQLYAYAADRPTIQRYAMAPKSPHSDE
jgi:hypothetical protein